MKKNKLTKGFTLIELLVVIAIIGILGAIIYAPFQSARRKGRDSQRVIEMKNLVSSLTLYADSHGGYFPCTLAVLQASQSDPLPTNANISSNLNDDNSKYNYVGYTDGSQDITGYSGSCQYRVLGFHLWTHLETNSSALTGAAKCQGFSNTANPNPKACINMGDTSGIGPAGIVASQTEPPDSAGSGGNAYSTTSRQVTTSGGSITGGDADSICATQQNFCILDYHQ